MEKKGKVYDVCLNVREYWWKRDRESGGKRKRERERRGENAI